MLPFPFRRTLKAVAPLLLGAWSIAGPLPASAENGGGLRVILDQDNLPYSSLEGHPSGLDAEIAGEIARRIDRPLQIVWANTLDEGFLTPVVTANGEADVAVGVPVEPAAVEDSKYVGREVLYSLPYASTGYVLVTARDHAVVDELIDVGRGVIGVEIGSVAASQLWDRGYLLRQFGAQDRILEAIASGDLEYGVLWSNSGWLIDQNSAFRGALTIQPAEIDMRTPRWNIALAVGHHNRELLPLVDSVIYAMRQEGVFRALYEKYHIPYFEPFEEGTPTP